LSHELDEFLEADLTSVISIENGHGDVNECSSWFVSTFPEIFSQIEGSEHSIVIIIEEIEDLLVDFNIAY
jgi:hypothetical protein